MYNIFVHYVFPVCVAIITLKALTVGSDFSFVAWMRDGKAYTKWYFNRPKWGE